MSFQPGPVLGLVVLALLYARAVRVLGGRGYRVPRGQQAYWWLGFACLAVAFLSPLDTEALKVVSAHMAQHVLMGDVAVPLMLIGARNPVLQFFLPRSILEPLARRHGLRAFFRRLRNPLLAIPLYTLVLYGWHIGPAFTAALQNDFVHGLQHQSFIAFSALVWWPLIEPNHRRMPGDLWKIPYIVGARLPTMFLGMGFVVAQTPFYSSFYGTGTRAGGLSAVGDQQLGGAIMMVVDVMTLMIVLATVFWRSARDDDAQAPVGEPRAQRHLPEVGDEREVQAGVQVAEVRQ
ncbi:MAG: putative rane protein [Thermoleophilaceae bacterium]|nr:putative rane protein [Thermoleophilaceae bacterium]